MDGLVVLRNPREGIFAIKIKDGSYTILRSSLDEHIAIGDLIHGSLQEKGHHSLLNITQKKNVLVSIIHTRSMVGYKAKQLVMNE